MAFLEPRAADLRDVAAAHLARTLREDASDTDLERERLIGLHELLAHAGRVPGQPVSLGLERAFRTDPAAQRRYHRVLASLSVGHSPAALAASSGPTLTREVGAYRLSLHEDGADTSAALLIAGPMSPRTPRAIEVHLEGEAVRVALPDPIGARIVILLDPTRPDTGALDRLLRRPAAEIFLV
jgi:hypothetical protein